MSVASSLNRALFPPRLLARHLRQKAGLKSRQPKLFFIGFNKTGTKTLHNFFRDNGYLSVHSSSYMAQRLGLPPIAKLMQQNRDKGLRVGRRFTHVFAVDVPGLPHPLLVSDAAINIAPDLMTKVEIVQNAIDMAHCLGIPQPRVGVLSAVETVTPTVILSVAREGIYRAMAQDAGVSHRMLCAMAEGPAH